ncbi:hypothetical protein PBI_EMERSON_91 [Mycobacterium phage Emerson]|nr:hypothetical protein PBI_EMERSON_91 [Mycobacterium phage Emerson]UVF60679.1 hypothetical protein SEA_PADPAT_92 [Mycobacterium phage Padpat]
MSDSTVVCRPEAMRKRPTITDPNLLRFEVDEEAGTAHLWVYGVRYEIRTIDWERADEMRYLEPYCSFPEYWNPYTRLSFRVEPAPLPRPAPPKPRRTWAGDMGLRRPKK